MLKFLGRGSAFTDEHNSAYFIENDELIKQQMSLAIKRKDEQIEAYNKQLKKSKTPVLFIHGEQDDYVPFNMLQKNFDACASKKDMLVVPDVGRL